MTPRIKRKRRKKKLLKRKLKSKSKRSMSVKSMFDLGISTKFHPQNIIQVPIATVMEKWNGNRNESLGQ